MNIVFYRYKSICEPDYIDAFKKLGITVIEDWDGADNNLTVSDRTVRLGNLIADNPPLFVFSINFFPFVANLCERLKIKYVAESVDCPVFEIFHKAVLSEYNRLFLFDRQQHSAIRDYNPTGVLYLPLGAATERVSALLGDTEDYKYDISFVGSLYNEKDPYLDLKIGDKAKERFDTLIKKQIESSANGLAVVEEEITPSDVEILKAADEDFYPSVSSVCNIDKYVAINDYLSPHMAYLERVELLNAVADRKSGKLHFFTQSKTQELSENVIVHGGVSSFTEMPFVFRQSKINLNITMRSIQTGIPQRVWDVLACKGFLITNDQPELHEYFEVGKHLEVYRDKEELLDKISYYLEHDDERRRIAEAGYMEVCEKHTVLHRVMSMIRAMQ